MKLIPVFLIFVACGKKDKSETGDTLPEVEDTDSGPVEDTDTGEVATITDVSFGFSASAITTKELVEVTATAAWSDGSTSDITAEASFASSDPAVVNFYVPGVGRPLSAGTAQITASYGAFSGVGDVTVTMALVAPGDLVINELLADPPGDSNGDGTTDSVEDEFLEIANHADATIDISGVMITETDIPTVPRHTVPEGTILRAGEALIVFGGGDGSAVATPTCQVQVATNIDSGLDYQLALNNEGDHVTLWMPDGVTAITDTPYGDEGTNDAIEDASLTLNPDVWGTTYTHHRYATNSVGNDSPCTYADGSAFPGPDGRFTP